MTSLDVDQTQPPQPVDLRLGRLLEFDRRSFEFPILDPVTASYPPRSYTWACPEVLSQGNVGACVGFSITHELAARPVKVGIPEATRDLAMRIYHAAQKIDPWPGEAYEGTSVLAGIKVAAQLGYYSEYRWAFGVDDLILALGYKGPAVLGVNWYSAMFTPDPAGLIRPLGSHVGGHAILANGIRTVFRAGNEHSLDTLDRDLTLIRLHNSWGSSWGQAGECFISAADLATLLGQAGEACIPVKRLDPPGMP